jgi:hypothetical protein
MPVSFLSSVLAAGMVYFTARAVSWELEDAETQEELLGSAPILAGLAAGAVAAIVTIIPAAGAGVLSDQLLLHYVAGSLGTAGSFMFTIACAEIMVHEETGNDRWEPRLAEDVVQKLGLRGELA